MFTKILDDKQVEEFNNIYKLDFQKILITKNKKYYYATVVDVLTKFRISEEVAKRFV